MPMPIIMGYVSAGICTISLELSESVDKSVGNDGNFQMLSVSANQLKQTGHINTLQANLRDRPDISVDISLIFCGCDFHIKVSAFGRNNNLEPDKYLCLIFEMRKKLYMKLLHKAAIKTYRRDVICV